MLGGHERSTHGRECDLDAMLLEDARELDRICPDAAHSVSR